MIENKTTLEINELLGMLQTLNELEYQEKREWVSVESLLTYIDSELKDLHTRLSDEELPELCQANCSGAIIWLDALRKELKGRGE